MSGSKKMIIRVQSPEGTARVEALADDSTAALYERVHAALELNSFAFALHRDRARRDELVSSKSRSLAAAGLQHGDLLYLSPVNGAVLFTDTHVAASTPAQSSEQPSGDLAAASTSKSTIPPPMQAPTLQEDEVDLELYKMSGSIQRQRDEKLCRHNSNGCCVHCSPLEPWDEGYLKEHNIKHMSFHSYLRKMQAKNFISLEELSLKIKPGCTDHPPWPRGICSKCQPGAVTLNRQQYRHVDNVLVEHPAPVERFLAYWRSTGHQRLAYLYGSYERHPLVPLGVRARVAALYEPAQTSSRDSITLQPDAKEEALREVAAGLGLRRLGWLFTDLVPQDGGAGTVRRLRGADTHFLSAQECITAGHYQNEHPSACRHAAAGAFGSKFVTVCVTGDEAGGVHLEGYQVSQQCAAMVRAGMLLPTRDAPDLAYVRDSSPAQYVPDVYYKERDAYGNEVGGAARRVPVAYLLVDVPCGVAAPPQPAPLFAPACSFPPAHRPLQHQLQTLAALHRHLAATPDFLEAVSDLHVLVFLASNEALPLTGSQLAPLLAAVRRRDAGAAERWRGAPHAATLLQLARAAAEQPAAALDAGAGGGGGGVWTCQLCTFHNAAHLDACEMCAMPRNASAM